ncbi:hypothetical protein [Agrococcus sp. HG114]|uniref:hypothetical protein n=1 Tax=Agrococcus sp. HG114 TaxID=2969757 RepID=UPI00215B5DB3|nr:hypothetical protein [Agrococcus sp. HG114]MCR8670940.1 hypothetical protein [Agrococcus sp. HG114]
MSRRPLAVALVLGAAVVGLTGCLPMPPAIPEAPPAPQAPVDPQQPVEPQPADPQPAEPATANTGLGESVTVDDGAGDSWSFAVAGIEENPPMESGDPASGTRFIAVLFDAQRVEGALSFIDLFDISVIADDGNQYHWVDTIQVTAEEDISYAEGDAFSGARAIVQLPEGVEPELVVVRSTYGQPEVEDVVVDVR